MQNENNKSLTEKLDAIDELSKAYQRILSVNKDNDSGTWSKVAEDLLKTIENLSLLTLLELSEQDGKSGNLVDVKSKLNERKSKLLE